MSTIEGPEYQKTRDALKDDPIIQAMATEMTVAWETNRFEFVHPAKVNERFQPRWEFMSGCGREYHRRGGELGHHIGGPAEAIIEILTELIP